MSNMIVQMDGPLNEEEKAVWVDAVKQTAEMFLPDREMCYACIDAGVHMGALGEDDASSIRAYIDSKLEEANAGTGTG